MVKNPVDLASVRAHPKGTSHFVEAREASVVLGESSEGGLVRVSQEGLESGTYILGKQGSGKSFLLLSTILQQIQGGGAVFVVDPHGDLIKEVISRLPERYVSKTCLFDLQVAREYPFGMNIFASPRQSLGVGGVEVSPASVEAKEAVRNQCMQAFGKLWSETKTGLYFEKMLRHLVALLLDNPSLTLASVPLLFTDDELRLRCTGRVRNPVSRAFWQGFNGWTASKREKETQPLLDRIDRLLSDDVVRAVLCQQGAYLDLRQAVLERKIILVNLRMKEIAYSYSASVLGTFFVSLLHSATFGLSDIPYEKRPGYSLFVDEFSNFGSDESYEQFFTEGRKYKVKQFLAHQYRSQLDRGGSTTNKEATTSAYTIVCMSCNDSDSKSMAGVFTGLPKQATNLYIDPVDRLDTHPSPLVKEFVLHYLNGLRGGAKLRITSETVEEYDYRKEKDVKVKREVFPWYDFGFGYLKCDPESCAILLDWLNHLLYDAQKDGRLSEVTIRQLADWTKGYGRLTGLIKTVEVENEEYLRVKAENERTVESNKRRIAEKRTREALAEKEYRLAREEIWEQRRAVEDEKRELEKAEKEYGEFLSRKAPLEQRIKKLYWDALFALTCRYSWEELLEFSWGDFFEDLFAGRGLILHPASVWSVPRRAVALEDNKVLIVENREVWERYAQGEFEEDGTGTHIVYPAPKEKLDIEAIYEEHGFDLWVMNFEQKNSLRNLKLSLQEWYAREGEEKQQNERRLEAIGLCQTRLCELETSLENTENAKRARDLARGVSIDVNEGQKPLPEQYRKELVVDPKLEEVVELLRGVLEAVIASPLTIDKSEYSTSELADILQKLEQREALVKTGRQVQRMTTLDVGKTYPALSPSQLHTRTTAILYQTIHQYCRPLAQVEREIEAVYAGDTSTPASGGQAGERVSANQPTGSGSTGSGGVNAKRADKDEGALPFASMPTMKEISGWDVFDKSEF